MKLIIQDHQGRRLGEVPFERDELTIGRDEANHIRLPERNVSRHHCRFIQSEEGTLVEDLQSSNGLWINGKAITGRRKVEPGDRISVGDYVIALDAGDSSRPATRAQGGPPAHPAPPRQAREPRRKPAPIPPFPGLPPSLEVTPGPRRSQEARRARPDADPHYAHSPGPQHLPIPPSLVPSLRPPAAAAPPAATPLGAEIASAPPPAPQREVPVEAARAAANEGSRLVVLTTELAGTSIGLPRTLAWIGRGPGAELVLGHRSVAPRHCRIEPIEGGYFIAKAAGELELSVNGAHCDEALIHPGDTLRIGAVLLRLVEGS